MHNYGRYCLGELDPFCKGIIGESKKVPSDSLADVWIKLMKHFAEYDKRVSGWATTLGFCGATVDLVEHGGDQNRRK